MKYIVIMIIAVLLLAGCTAVVEEAEPTDVIDEVDTQIPDTNSPIPIETFAISPGDFETGFVTKNLAYVASEENEFGDRSSIRNVVGTSMYEASAELTFSYTPLLADTTFYLKILGYGFSQKQDNIIYEGELTSGEKTIPVEMMILHPEQEGRLLFCFGFTPDFDPLMDEEQEDVICISRLLNKPENDFELTSDKYSLYATVTNDVAFAEKNMFIRNTGNTPLTIFIYTPESEKYTIETELKKVFVLPGEQKVVALSVSYPYEGDKQTGKETGGVYILPNGCEPNLECFEESRFRREIEISII